MDESEVEQILSELRSVTGAGRVTLRLGGDFDLAGEVRAAGVLSMRGAVQPDAAGSETYRFLREQRRVLVQDDCETAAIAPPRSTRERFGVRAQMLGPIVIGGQTRGVVSVHATDGPRHWTEADVAALEETTGRIASLVAGGEPRD